ncbi:MAG: hypothetical protein COB04_12420 [Gammaproteobacteria bacterium]|nr:MAG: hypothetical protein COB04_12420 [Gammaproteobacteria bacterium]
MVLDWYANVTGKLEIMISNYVAIGIRFVSVLLFFHAIKEFFLTFQILYGDKPYNEAASVWPIFVVASISWVFAFLLWFSARRLGLILTSGIDSEVKSLPPISLLAVFVASMGLYFFGYGTVDALYYLALGMMAAEADVGAPSADTTANMLATAFEVLGGCFLIMKARFVAAKINEVAT